MRTFYAHIFSKMASKPVTTEPPTISVEKVVQEFFSDMKRELNIKAIASALYTKKLIAHSLKQNINREAIASKDANELLLDHLIRNCNLETFSRFCDVLEETAESNSLPHHRDWSNKLKQKLTEISPSGHKLKRISPYPIASAWNPNSHTMVYIYYIITNSHTIMYFY